jgi:Ca-activated chloride channel homolog
MTMKFADAGWIWLLPVVLLWGAAWAVILVRNHRRREARFTALAVAAPRAAAFRAKIAGHLLLVFGLVCIVAVLARPQGAPRPAPGARMGVNLALLVDASSSMRCEDVLPNRLQVARQAVEAIAVEASGSRVAMFMFGGAPTLMIPGTFDTASVMLAARAISPDFVGKGGTAMGPALKRAEEYLLKAGSQPKAVIVISDGEEGEGDPILTAAELWQNGKLPVHTISIGSASGGTIPLYTRNLRGEFERAGERQTKLKQTIVTHANPELMARVAEAGGGRSVDVRAENVEKLVTALVREAIMPHARAIDDAATMQSTESSWIFLLLAIGAFTAEQWLRHAVARRFALQPLPVRRDPVWSEVAVPATSEASR